MADAKLTALNEIGAALLGTDIFYVVDNPGGTPLSRKCLLSRVPTLVGETGLTMTAPIGATQTELTIAANAITVTRNYHRVDTTADAGSTDLSTINGGVDGMVLVLRAEHTDRSVVVKDGTGNIQGPGDVTLNNTQDTITLVFDATLNAWLVTSVSDNGA